jgi:hypothetical protein
VSDYDVIVLGGGAPAGTALRRWPHDRPRHHENAHVTTPAVYGPADGVDVAGLLLI